MQIHGGDIYRNVVELDFSANINPFGMPESVEQAAIKGIRESIHYPDTQCSELKKAIADKEKVQADWIVCGNGAAEVIFQLVLAKKPKQALLIYPTFLEYEQALQAVGCQIQKTYLTKENGFRVTRDILEQITEKMDLMFLCNPNNPTGETVEPELLTAIIDRCKEKKVLLVIDECFQDFLMEEEQDSRKEILKDNPDLFLLKAFTKMYGMAGLRLGYGICANEEFKKQMAQVTQPWNVSIPAQMAGIAACGETDFVKRTREYVALQREYLKEELDKLGFIVYPSKANYLFFEGPKGLYEECLKNKVLIRSCANYDGLDDTYYRIAVKSKDDNETLIQILQRIKRESTWQK